MKKLVSTLVAVLLIAALFLAGCGGLKQKDQGLSGVDWPMYGGSPARPGYSPESFAPPFELKWRAGTSGLEGGAAVAEGYVCVADTAGKVRYLNATTGEVKWTFDGNGPFRRQTPLIYDSRVFAASEKGTLYCLDKLSGRRLWEKDLGQGSFSSPLGDGDLVYISHNASLYCFSTREGNQVFIYSEPGAKSLTAPALLKGKIYAGSDIGSMVCLDAANGSLTWSSTPSVEITCTPVLTEMRVFFGTADNQLWCLDRLNGQTQWTAHLQQKVAAPPAISGYDIICGAGDAGSLVPGVVWCLDAVSGKERWRYETDYRGPLHVSVSDTYAFIYNGLVLNLADGTILASLHVGGNPYAPPVPYGGCLFICATDGTLYCLGP